MRPTIKFLSESHIKRIIDQAFEILTQKGICVENEHALTIFSDGGARIDSEKRKAFITQDSIDNALKSIPSAFNLYDVHNNQTHQLEDNNIHFTPGSSSIYFLDGADNEFRKPLTADYIKYAKLVDQLEYIAAQSTAFIPSDVPDKAADSYRLFLSLLYCHKPVVTGAFTIASFEVMKNLLLTVRGSEANLKEKPLAVFSCCPTSPLKWSEVTSQNLIDCARYSIPVEIIAMPLTGFISPVTLTGTLVQHTIETISGIVLSQLVNPGTPLLYGGSPAAFDVRNQTTPMGAIETMMIDCAYNEIGKYLGIPTQAYISLSDAKLLDTQAGLETGMGATLAALAGINSISGPGMLDFENCFSLEKLVVDNEICRMVFRMIKGIDEHKADSLSSIFDELLDDGHLLASEHTMQYLRKEHIFPGTVIERGNRGQWIQKGEITLTQRANIEAEKLISGFTTMPLKKETQKDLVRLMTEEASRHGLDKLPDRES